MNTSGDYYLQKIEYARASLWVPFYTVGITARISGNVPPERMAAALRKLQVLYPPLACRAQIDTAGAAWITTEGVSECSLEVREKTTDDDWEKIYLEQERVPFNITRGPLARFFLLRGSRSSDLVVIAPHVICDGYSITQVLADAVALLNDPDRQVQQPAPPPAVTWRNVAHAWSDNLLFRGLAWLVNRLWPYRHVLRQEEYEELHRIFWSKQKNDLLTFTLSPAETCDLAVRCKQQGISMTGAMGAAFLLAHRDLYQITRAFQTGMTVAVNLRDRLIQPPGRVVGVYASSVNLYPHIKKDTAFWDLARNIHIQIHKGMKDRPRLLITLVLEQLDPGITDLLARASSTNHWGHETAFMAPFLKIREDERCLDISNIGRIELPDPGGPFYIETLLPFPPLVPGGRLALNVLTVNGQMNLILKYRPDKIEREMVIKIKDRAMSYLFENGHSTTWLVPVEKRPEEQVEEKELAGAAV